MNVPAKTSRCAKALFVAFTVAIQAGCQSGLVSEAVDPARALAGPYALRLALDRPVASPGETVLVSIEFENTGPGDLWIPRQREVFFGYEQKSEFGEVSAEEWQSSCDGLEYVRVKPGRRVKYEKDFPVPAQYGEIGIFITANREVKVPLTVVRKEPKAVVPVAPPRAAGSG